MALTSRSPIVGVSRITDNMHHGFLVVSTAGYHILVAHLSPFTCEKRLQEVQTLLAAIESEGGRRWIILGDLNSFSPLDEAGYADGRMLEVNCRGAVKPGRNNLAPDGGLDFVTQHRLLDSGFTDAFKYFHPEYVPFSPPQSVESCRRFRSLELPYRLYLHQPRPASSCFCFGDTPERGSRSAIRSLTRLFRPETIKKLFLAALLSAFILSASAQIRNEHVYKYPERDAFCTRMNLRLPQIEGYETLTGDFHIHTVFSDGKVWPDVRVNEAWRDGLDVIAITDHLEYRPQGKRIEGDLNASYRIAAERGKQLEILVVPGAEITRQKPVGHLNALFIADRYGIGRCRRPMTILFCKEHSLAGVREAVESQRTIASFNDVLIGREELLRQFVSACLELRTVVEAESRYEILNRSDLTFELVAGEVYYRIDPNATIRFTLKKPQLMVLKNCFVSRGEQLRMNW